MPAICVKGTRDHHEDEHLSDLSHNPWAEPCSKRLPNEPSCPEAVCKTCGPAGQLVWMSTEDLVAMEKGVTLVTIVHDDNGDPSPIVMTGIQPGETIRVDMVGGKVSVDTKNKPTVINADTGEEITNGASSSPDAP